MTALCASLTMPHAPLAEHQGDLPVRVSIIPGMRIDEALLLLSQQSGVAIQAYGTVAGSRVGSIAINDKPIEEALNGLATPNGWVWFRERDGSYGLADQSWYRGNKLCGDGRTEKIFRPDYIRASQLAKIMQPMLADGVGTVTFNDDINKLIVSAPPEVIRQVERVVRCVDVALLAV